MSQSLEAEIERLEKSGRTVVSLESVVQSAHLAGQYETVLFLIGDLLATELSNDICLEKISRVMEVGMNRQFPRNPKAY